MTYYLEWADPNSTNGNKHNLEMPTLAIGGTNTLLGPKITMQISLVFVISKLEKLEEANHKDNYA